MKVEVYRFRDFTSETKYLKDFETPVDLSLYEVCKKSTIPCDDLQNAYEYLNDFVQFPIYVADIIRILEDSEDLQSDYTGPIGFFYCDFIGWKVVEVTNTNLNVSNKFNPGDSAICLNNGGSYSTFLALFGEIPGLTRYADQYSMCNVPVNQQLTVRASVYHPDDTLMLLYWFWKILTATYTYVKNLML